MGLRERKKHQTRLALIDAAFDLFLVQGYEATTVDQIAAAVDVSPRTFFRYFGSKEDLALDFTVEYEELVTTALAARPAGEAPLAALATAFREFIHQMEANAADDTERFLKHRRVIDANPALLATGFARMAETEKKLTAELARRQGTDPAADPRPRLLVALITSALRVGFECAAERDCQLVGLVGNVTDLLNLAEAALTPGWGQLSLGSSGQVATKASSPG
ncbi:TetR/AcrR family transcriptional regulator [Sphaerisporangium corydalis]|uniref:TetR/AcrR family transcriptional regulator n=1 Tax=Sphaerisporangium corydalis TaxID=1441875 RepID=A0ABV9EMQ5_9ACTN|nr:TetR family transcriptional regulator [Sphaerisporangium corydalis]